MSTQTDPEMIEAVELARRILHDRRTLLASRNPAEQARAHRLIVAMTEVIDAGRELIDQDHAAEPGRMERLAHETFAAGVREGLALPPLHGRNTKTRD